MYDQGSVLALVHVVLGVMCQVMRAVHWYSCFPVVNMQIEIPDIMTQSYSKQMPDSSSLSSPGKALGECFGGL